MQKLKTILIVYSLSFTALGQNDSIYCFNKSQVKTFLTTKIELDNCKEQYNYVFNEKEAISDTLIQIKEDNSTLLKKVRRNRLIAISGIGGFITTIILLFTIN